MALQELPFSPDLPAFDYQINLDGDQYTLIYEYSDERQSWYLSIEDVTGDRLLTRQRLTPGADHTRALLSRGPRGILSCIGSDPYARNELSITYLPEADLAALTQIEPRDDILVILS